VWGEGERLNLECGCPCFSARCCRAGVSVMIAVVNVVVIINVIVIDTIIITLISSPPVAVDDLDTISATALQHRSKQPTVPYFSFKNQTRFQLQKPNPS
jgi:hypothetical protein